MLTSPLFWLACAGGGLALAWFFAAVALGGRADDDTAWLEELIEDAAGDLPHLPSARVHDLWPSPEPEHSHRSALAGRRPNLGVFAAGNGRVSHHVRILGDD